MKRKTLACECETQRCLLFWNGPGEYEVNVISHLTHILTMSWGIGDYYMYLKVPDDAFCAKYQEIER